jgi:hypothetical protein
MRQDATFHDLTYRVTACGFAALLLWSLVGF